MLSYRDGTFERVRAPIMIGLAEHDLELSNAFIRAKAAAARSVEIRAYPGGHFDLYHEPSFDRVAADRAAFLQAHTRAQDADRR